eukprot:comp18853_c0_seq1/m.34435 comp18853_c0_seq1/g.34435  ORF comp18853_c0_seq1/g.34435 comp18853_c0_seq1/m.34435 type:complete len:305 (+) comp18853_c0_seq1:188-1102(+)
MRKGNRKRMREHSIHGKAALHNAHIIHIVAFHLNLGRRALPAERIELRRDTVGARLDAREVELTAACNALRDRSVAAQHIDKRNSDARIARGAQARDLASHIHHGNGEAHIANRLLLDGQRKLRRAEQKTSSALRGRDDGRDNVLTRSNLEAELLLFVCCCAQLLALVRGIGTGLADHNLAARRGLCEHSAAHMDLGKTQLRELAGLRGDGDAHGREEEIRGIGKHIVGASAHALHHILAVLARACSARVAGKADHDAGNALAAGLFNDAALDGEANDGKCRARELLGVVADDHNALWWVDFER